MTKYYYYIRARLFPTILTIIPLLIFVNTVIVKHYSEALKEIISVLPLITHLGLSAALIFMMVQINRFLSKEIFQKFYFQDEIKMPSTNHLIWSDKYLDNSIKLKIRTKINQKFNIFLMPEDEERNNELTSRKQIVTAVSQIRNSLRDNKLLLQHNIEYGFFRNLIGGCVMALLFGLTILIYGVIKDLSVMKIIGIVCIGIYSLPIFVSKPIINRFGIYYSKVLYEQFLSL